MTWTVLLDPPAVATNRTQLNLNSGPIRVKQDGIDWGDAQIQAYMADQAVGSSPVDYRLPNRTITIPLGLGMDDSGTFDTAVAQLRQKVALFQREGGWLQRGSTVPLYADVVNATLALPDKLGETGGLEDGVTLQLECLPDFYGAEVALDAVNANVGHVATLLKSVGTPAVIGGDHPGRVRIIVTNGTAADDHMLLWGLRSRYYDSAATAALFYEAENNAYFTYGLGGSQSVARTGASGGNVLRTPTASGVGSTKIVLSGTGLTHLGAYRVLARVYSPAATPPALALQWGAAPMDRSGWAQNDWAAIPAAGAFYLVDLGTVDMRPPPVPGATHSWSFNVLARSATGTTTANDIVDSDCLYFIPVDDGAGRVEAIANATGVGALLSTGITELRTDGAYISASASTAYSRSAAEFGELPRIPVSALEGRSVELFVRPSQQVLDLSDSFVTSDLLDTFNVQVKYRPCYLFRP